jgi:hypothetical protein
MPRLGDALACTVEVRMDAILAKPRPAAIMAIWFRQQTGERAEPCD